MSQKSERKKKLRAEKQAAASKAPQVNEADDLRYIKFGVARLDCVDHIVRIGDPANDNKPFEQNFTKFMAFVDSTKTDAAPFVNFIDLYENGRASAVLKIKGSKDPTFEQRFEIATSEFKERLEADYYDREFPEHAAVMNAFVQKMVHNISAETHVPVQMPEGVAINPEYLMSTIENYLNMAKQQIAETGEAAGMIGWGTEDGLIIYDGGLKWQKYRFGRAISEVAAIINAPRIVQGGEVWVRDPKTNERTGEEGVMASVISPDGEVVADGGFVFHRNPLKFEESRLIAAADKAKQFLFPKWAYFPTPATAAA